MGKSIIDFINKILDTKKFIFRLWIVLWLCLLILLVLKFCFGIWYPIIIENEQLLYFNEFICNSWIKYIILSLFYFASVNIMYLTCCIKKKYDKILEAIIINVLILISFMTKIFFRNFSVIPEILVSIIIPILYLLKNHKKAKKWKLILFPIAIQILVFAWQLNIYLVRGIDFVIDSDNHVLIGIVLQIDYYIFLIISWIGVSYMGLFSLWIFGKDITALKAEKEKELSKAEPNMAKVKEIDERIKELETEA